MYYRNVYRIEYINVHRKRVIEGANIPRMQIVQIQLNLGKMQWINFFVFVLTLFKAKNSGTIFQRALAIRIVIRIIQVCVFQVP